MSQVVIYKQDNGVVAVVIPSEDALQTHTLMEIAIKDVPYGKKFKIIDYSDLPLNVPQEAWDVNENDLTDGVGGESNEFN
jgi:hypothetical protein